MRLPFAGANRDQTGFAGSTLFKNEKIIFAFSILFHPVQSEDLQDQQDLRMIKIRFAFSILFHPVQRNLPRMCETRSCVRMRSSSAGETSSYCD